MGEKYRGWLEIEQFRKTIDNNGLLFKLEDEELQTLFEEAVANIGKNMCQTPRKALKALKELEKRGCGSYINLRTMVRNLETVAMPANRLGGAFFNRGEQHWNG